MFLDHHGEVAVVGINFSAESLGRAVRVRVSHGGTYVVTPGEFRGCLARARGQVAGGSRDLVLSVPGKLRLRLAGCPREELEAVVSVMAHVLAECRDRAAAYAASN
jgi:hypothetical protein